MATIEEVLSIKFPFIRDLGIINNPFYNSSHFPKGKLSELYSSTKYHKNRLILKKDVDIPLKLCPRGDEMRYEIFEWDWISYKLSSILINGTITIFSKLTNQGLYFTIDSGNSKSFNLVIIKRGKIKNGIIIPW